MKYLIAILTLVYICTASLHGMEKSAKEEIENIMSLLAKKVRKCACGKEFNSYEQIVTHVKDFHQPWITYYICPICPPKSRTLESLLLHFTSHTDEIIYNCGLCGYSESHSSRIKYHLQFHAKNSRVMAYLKNYSGCLKIGENSFKCPHSGCSSITKNIGHLFKHILSTHINKPDELHRLQHIDKLSPLRSDWMKYIDREKLPVLEPAHKLRSEQTVNNNTAYATLEADDSFYELAPIPMQLD